MKKFTLLEQTESITSTDTIMQTNKTSLDDLKKEALKQYEEGARAIHHWNSFIVKCIQDYQPIEQPTDVELETWGELMKEDLYERGHSPEETHMIVRSRISGAKAMRNGEIPAKEAKPTCKCKIPYFPTGDIHYCSKCNKKTIY